MKGIKSLFKLFLLALVTIVVAGILIKRDYDKALDTPNSNTSEKVTVTLEEGTSMDSIISKLVDSGLIKENWAKYLKVYVKLNNLGTKVQAGTYQIPKNLTIKELMSTIQHAEDPSIWVTIPEGLRKDEIATIVDIEFKKVANTSFSKEEFLSLTTNKEYINSLNIPFEVKDLEGFLFPDKYSFALESDTRTVMNVLVTNFKKKVNIQKITYNELIIASMVEREGYTSQDRPMIADIIKRRYNEGWLLGIDATLLYPLKDWKHIITNVDKASDSPYNSYKKPGLPPTPISNPGIQSIEATLNPQPNRYYYYIHDENGNAHFAETLPEHNNNIQQYLR